MEIQQFLIMFLLWLFGVACGLMYSMALADKITKQIIRKYYNKTL